MGRRTFQVGWVGCDILFLKYYFPFLVAKITPLQTQQSQKKKKKKKNLG